MIRKLFLPILAALLVFSLLFLACSGGSADSNTASLSAEDFEYTLTADKSVYDADSLDPSAPFDVTLSVVYTGELDSIDLWCVEDLGTITIENEDGQSMLPEEYQTHDTSRVTLKKGTPYEIRWNGAEEYKEYGGIPAGDYTIVAYLNFSTDATYESIQENTLDVSVQVK